MENYWPLSAMHPLGNHLSIHHFWPSYLNKPINNPQEPMRFHLWTGLWEGDTCGYSHYLLGKTKVPQVYGTFSLQPAHILVKQWTVKSWKAFFLWKVISPPVDNDGSPTAWRTISPCITTAAVMRTACRSSPSALPSGPPGSWRWCTWSRGLPCAMGMREVNVVGFMVI